MKGIIPFVGDIVFFAALEPIDILAVAQANDRMASKAGSLPRLKTRSCIPAVLMQQGLALRKERICHGNVLQ